MTNTPKKRRKGRRRKSRLFYTIGSSQAEVLGIEGQPDSFSDIEFCYGFAKVFFRQGRVVKWVNSFDRRLKAKLRPKDLKAIQIPDLL